MWSFKIILFMVGLWLGNFPFALFLLFGAYILENRWKSLDYDFFRARINLNSEFNRQQAKRGMGGSEGEKTFIYGATNYFYNMNKLNENDYRFEYVTHLVKIAAAIISSDKIIHPKEVDTLMNFVEQFGFSAEYLKAIKEDLDKALSEEIFIPGECDFIRKSMRLQDRIEFIRMLFIIASSDRKLSKEEEYIIEEVAFDLYLTDEDYRSIRAEFKPRFNSNYEILGVPESSGVKEIKQAYKQLVRKNHPDKFVHLGKKFTLSATERIKKINAAYTTIRRERGF
jgi:DnaJ like chaperone protein